MTQSQSQGQSVRDASHLYEVERRARQGVGEYDYGSPLSRQVQHP